MRTVSNLVLHGPHHSRNEMMNRAPVLFRVDASTRLGWESLNRCLSLAAALQRRRRPAYFLAQLEPSSLVPPRQARRQ